VAGLLRVNHSAASASFRDMFRSEETGDAPEVIDITKVQMFLITLAVWTAFLGGMISALPGMVAGVGPPVFPEVSATMTALLGISHAGYLGLKVVDRTPRA